MHVGSYPGAHRSDEYGAVRAARLLAEGLGKDGKDEKPDTAPDKPSAAPPVTGVGSALAPETVAAAQKIQETPGTAETDAVDSYYKEVSKKILDKFPGLVSEIEFREFSYYASVSDSSEFESWVEEQAYLPTPVGFKGTPGLAEGSAQFQAESLEADAFFERAIPQAEAIDKQRIDLYKKMKAEGVPPLDQYMRILEFNASLPTDFGDSTHGHTSSQKPIFAPGEWNKIQEAMLAAFKAAVAAYGTKPEQQIAAGDKQIADELLSGGEDAEQDKAAA